MTGTPTFFVAGGTVPPGSPSYVERGADAEIYEALLGREYCYVLNSRQMGKSSLAVRAMARLIEAGVRCAFVDLTKIGAAGVTEEQWYAGILAEIARNFGLRKELGAHLKQHAAVSPSQRFLTFVQEVVAGHDEKPVVIMIDEIDAVRSLSFSTDAFFAGIRQCWNARSTEPHLAKLTFCLMGTALPGDLIRNGRMTPFNVGRRIELRSFSPEEAKGFEVGILHVDRSQAAALVRRVVHWTGGQPFLTQRLCRELVEEGVTTVRGVDEVVHERYLTERARETDSHLADIGNRLLGWGDPDTTEEARADVLALYAKFLKVGINDDESNPGTARIKMSGVARLEGRRLIVRNPIYRIVFGPEWIRQNMPSQELRRQRLAFVRGVLRTGFVAVGAVALVGGLAWNNFRLAAQARTVARQARSDAYFATMQFLPYKDEDGKPSEVERLVKKLEGHPDAGWEWKYWRNSVPQADIRYEVGDLYRSQAPDNEGRNVFVAGIAEARLYEIRSGKLIKRFPIPKPDVGAWSARWCEDGRRLLMQDYDQHVIVLDAFAGKVLRQRRLTGAVMLSTKSRSGYLPQGEIPMMMWDEKKSAYGAYRISPDDLSVKPLHLEPNKPKRIPYVVADGKSMISTEEPPGGGYEIQIRDPRDTRKTLDRLPRRHEPVGVMLDQRRRKLYFVEDSARLIEFDLRLRTERVLGILPVPCNYAELAKDGRSILIGDSARSACLVRLDRKGFAVSVIHEARDAFFAGEGDAVVISNEDFRVYRLDQLPSSLDLPADNYQRAFVLRDGRAFATSWGSGTHKVERILDLTQSNPVMRETQGPMQSSVDDRLRFRWAGNGERWMLFDYLNHQVIDRGSEDPKNYDVWSSPDGRYIAHFSGRHHVAVYDVTRRKQVHRLEGIDSATAIRFSEDGKYLAVGDEHGAVHVWRVSDWSLVQRCPLAPSVICAFDFSPDGSKLLAGSDGEEVAIMEIETGRFLATLRGSAGTVFAVAWSPDGKRIAAGGTDCKVRLWDAESGREIGAIGRHPARVLALGFLPGGRTLASIGADGSVRRWMTEDRL